ncbi:MAG: TonB-dependent receptor, partial [Bacteroidota bacterium]
RYLEDRPANEDESIIAEGYTIFDLNANYRVGPFTFGVWIENLFDADWEETQFDTTSRIRDANGVLEAAPVGEIHFTPGTPLAYRLSLQYSF